MIRCILITFFSLSCICVPPECVGCPQDLFQDEIKAADLADAEKQLQKFLDREKSFPKRYAVESVIEFTQNGKSSYNAKAKQWIVVDEAQDRWIAQNTSQINRTRKESEHFKAWAFWNNKFLWMKQDDGAFEFQSEDEEWHTANIIQNNLKFAMIHPRYSGYAWPNTMDSFEFTSLLLLGGKDCVGIAREAKLTGSYWANKKTKGLNRVTGIFFDAKGDLAKVKCLPSIKGDFDSEEVLRLVQESKSSFEADLTWKQHDRNTRVLERMALKHSSDRNSHELVITSRWLLGDQVKEKFFADPREEDAPNLEDLDFDQPPKN